MKPPLASELETSPSWRRLQPGEIVRRGDLIWTKLPGAWSKDSESRWAWAVPKVGLVVEARHVIARRCDAVTALGRLV